MARVKAWLAWLMCIKELKTKMKKENLVCVETDKTGKFALDTKENYVKKIKNILIWMVLFPPKK